MKGKNGAAVWMVIPAMIALWIAASVFRLIPLDIAFPHDSRGLALGLACAVGSMAWLPGLLPKIRAKRFPVR